MTSTCVSWRHTNPCVTLFIAASLIVACGGGAKSTSSSDTGPTPPINNPPTISGTPMSAVTRDQPYEFTPTASDPDGDKLTFSITNQPAWATFDTTTGELAGVPGEVDIGTTPEVTISVTDSDLSASLAPFDLEVKQIPFGSATVSWDIPTKNADGTDMTDLAGFRVHYGTASQDYSEVVEVKDATADSKLIEDLEPATYFFAVTAVDLVDNESALSDEVSKVVGP